MRNFGDFQTFGQLATRFQIRPKGIIHLGAHLAEERDDYVAAGVSRVLWIEANPELIDELSKRVQALPGHTVASALVSNRDGVDQTFHVASFSQSSSILPLGTHRIYSPSIVVEKSVRLRTTRMDTFFRERRLDPTEYDYLHLDLQGAELLALAGFGSLLRHAHWINLEVNTGNLYDGCPKLTTIDRFLFKAGLLRVGMHLTSGHWGDALYIRRNGGECAYLRNLAQGAALQAWAAADMLGRHAPAPLKTVGRGVRRFVRGRIL